MSVVMRIGRGDENAAGRLRAFSDGVFAIVLTLLVLELKLPEERLHAEREVAGYLLSLIPNFAGYLLSFILVGLFWMIHVGIDRELLGADRKTLAVTLVAILPITTLPFTTGLLAKALLSPLGWAFYAGNIALAALGTVLLWRSVVKRGFVTPGVERGAFGQIPWRGAILAGAFLLSIPATFLDPISGRYVPILAPIGAGILRRRMKVVEPEESEAPSVALPSA